MLHSHRLCWGALALAVPLMDTSMQLAQTSSNVVRGNLKERTTMMKTRMRCCCLVSSQWIGPVLQRPWRSNAAGTDREFVCVKF